MDTPINTFSSDYFQTKRLRLRKLESTDANLFYKMMSNPKVMNPIPQPVFSRQESDGKLRELMNQKEHSDIRIFAVTEKGNDQLIGIAGYLKNDENEEEIAYRFLEKYWGIGYGTEIAKGLIDHAFNNFEITRITADVNTANDKSIKILNKFFSPIREFYNPKDQCTDRRYHLEKTTWEKWT